ARIPLGRRRGLPRARAVRAVLRRGVRRDGHRHARLACRDRGGVEGLCDERAHPRGPGARIARAEARGQRRAEAALPSPALLPRGAPRLRAGRARRRRGAAAGRAPPPVPPVPRRGGDSYLLDGSKRFITTAAVASLYTVFAKT